MNVKNQTGNRNNTFESDNFGGPKIVGGGICPTQRANKVCCGIIEVMEMEMETERLGGLFDGEAKHQAGSVWNKSKVAPTIDTMQGGCREPMIIEANSIRMVRTEDGKALRKQYENHKIHHGFNEHREPELRKDGVTNTLSTVQKDNYICVAMRGRNPTNPSDRTPGIELEQTLEVNQNGTTNCLTSVQKDNLVLEKPVQLGFLDSGTGKHQSNTVYDEKSLCPNIITIDGGETQQIKVMTENVYDFYNDKMKQDGVCGTLTTGTAHNGSGSFGVVEGITTKGKHIDVASTILSGYERTNMTGFNADNGVVETINKVGQISNDGSQYGTVIADNGLSPNLVAGTHGYANSCIATQYRIRKLTPRECWRLMDFSDEDFEKAAEVNSNTQLYKQAGNSIVVNVLVAILGQLLPGKENVYKELSE